MWHARSLVAPCGIQFPDQGLNPGPLHWERRVLATGPPRKSQHFLLYISINKLQIPPKQNKTKIWSLERKRSYLSFSPNCLMVALLPIVGGAQGPASPLRTHPWSFSLFSPDYRASACGSGWPGRCSDPSCLCIWCQCLKDDSQGGRRGQLQTGTCHGHLPSTSTRLKPCAVAAAGLQPLLQGVQSGYQE